MTPPRILIACVGNIFLGDDAFGVEAARRLAPHPWPEGVRVVDFGIRGLDLTYALLEDYEAVVLVDANPRGGPPGTLYLLELDPGSTPEHAGLLEGHNMHPARVLCVAREMGSPVKRFFLVGCEPTAVGGGDDMQMGLSEPVRAALDGIVPLVESVVARALSREPGLVRT